MIDLSNVWTLIFVGLGISKKYEQAEKSKPFSLGSTQQIPEVALHIELVIHNQERSGAYFIFGKAHRIRAFVDVKLSVLKNWNQVFFFQT